MASSDAQKGSVGAMRRGLLGLVVLCLCAAIGHFSVRVIEQLDLLETAASDNVQWTLSQSEVEAGALESALRIAAVSDPPDLGEVRRRFDIFYSRVTTLRKPSLAAEFRRDPAASRALLDLDDFIARSTALIDGPDDTLIAALPALFERASAARLVTRDLAVAGIRLNSRLSDARRADLRGTLLGIAGFTGVLVLLLMASIAVLVRLVAATERGARDIRLTRDRLETILSTSIDAVIVTDPNGRIVEYNGAAERIFGHPREAALGADMAELIVPERHRAAHAAGMLRYAETGEARILDRGVVQLEARRSTGEVFPVDVSLARAHGPDGARYIGFIRDVSARVAAETELRDARDRAIAGERSKANLLAVMSHEMRTPLNGMLGTLDLFDTDRLDAEHRRYFHIVRESGNVLLGHVNDVLDISRLDAGKMTLNPGPVDLGVLLTDLVDSQQGPARQRGNHLRLGPTAPALRDLWTDPLRLRQILLNLVGNAIKFTRNGEILVEADPPDAHGRVALRVIDNGIGIATADLDRIFGDFVTIDASYTRSADGTGLGLGICRRLTTALGGTLEVASTLGQGSTFTLTLPMTPPAAAPAPRITPAAAAPAPVGPLDILVVEDNATNRMVLRAMLGKRGHRMTEAHDGAEGVKLAERRAFDVILMDISMPGMDGVTACRTIRTGDGPCAQVPIIATTAHALPEEIARFRAAGMTDVLIKPLSLKTLSAALAAAVSAPALADRVAARP